MVLKHGITNHGDFYTELTAEDIGIPTNILSDNWHLREELIQIGPKLEEPNWIVELTKFMVDHHRDSLVVESRELDSLYVGLRHEGNEANVFHIRLRCLNV
jgi:hypothetical protein